ncbi:ribonuclease H-like domain-containing protein [Gloeopeniophorella convolvens]|nr:ribonuclease H-like domain-containing protein [Gloeopeniophorella convolvens]
MPREILKKNVAPGPYVALDCEMVGVGPMGSESTLARVSVVNFFGAVLLDEFVRQKERVTDWRTQWSGIRAKDMVNAKPFEEVQSTVAELIKDRVIVGHAIQNDLKALMLSHPRAQIRDTQLLAHKHGQSRSSRPALRNLVREMLGAQIQEGEHSSVTDARATIAVYRLHRKQWEKGYSVVPIRVQKGKAKAEPSPEETPTTDISQKRTHTSTEEQNEDNAERPAKTSRLPKSGSVPKGVAIQRKGVSSGLSTVVRRRAKGKDGVGGTKAKWWTELGSGKSKGSIKISV